MSPALYQAKHHRRDGDERRRKERARAKMPVSLLYSVARERIYEIEGDDSAGSEQEAGKSTVGEPATHSRKRHQGEPMVPVATMSWKGMGRRADLLQHFGKTHTQRQTPS